MFKNCLIMLIVLQLGVFYGCATLEQADGSSKEETKKLRMSKDQMWDKMAELEGENTDLIKEINATDREAQRVWDRDKKKVAHLSKQIKQLERTNRKIKTQSQVLVKVLVGNNNMVSATGMANKLRKMGYTVKVIDYAPVPRFSRDTIFYAAGVKNRAEKIASRLGGNTITKSISWYSIFDIIAVTGETP